MSQSVAGLNNPYHLGQGVTPHFAISYNSSLIGQPGGANLANRILKKCEQDFALIHGWFGGIDLTFSFPITVHIEVTGPAGTWDSVGPPISINLGGGSSIDFARFLIVAELTEMFMLAKGNGWGYSDGDSNEGNKGEALSRFLTGQFLITNGISFAAANYGGSVKDWLNAPRNAASLDTMNGCVLFLYYLHSQLGFSIESIINAGAQNIRGVYTKLTDDFSDPFPFLKKLMNALYPTSGGSSLSITGANPDNPFPIVMQMQITCIIKYGTPGTGVYDTFPIQNVGGRNHTLHKNFRYTQKECIAMINGGESVFPGEYNARGNYRFYVKGGGKTSDVAVYQHNVPGPDNFQLTSYIATEPDRTKKDNLLSLKECV